MALIDVGSDMNRRAESRAMTFLHSSEWERNLNKSRLYADREIATMEAGRDENFGRSANFYVAAEAHESKVGHYMSQQKIPARGIIREKVTPRTKPQLMLGGSKN